MGVGMKRGREIKPNTKPTDGHPRLCPRCKRNVSTKKSGRYRTFNTHGPDPDGGLFCRYSGNPV